MKSVFALGALVAASVVNAGKVIIQNKCDYDVAFQNTPAGGESTVPPPGWQPPVQNASTIPAGQSETDSCEYVALWRSSGDPGDGWSLKMWPASGTIDGPILQLETTVHNDGTLWFDLSGVNGGANGGTGLSPWYNNTMKDTAFYFTSSNTQICAPTQNMYRYATDDAHGMQDCPDEPDVHLIMNLCEIPPGSPASDASSAAAPAATQPTSAATQPAPATQPTTSSQVAPASPSTFATSVNSLAAAPSSSSSLPPIGEKQVVVPTTTAVAAATSTALGTDAAGNVIVVTHTAFYTHDMTSTIWATRPTGQHWGQHRRRHAI